MGRPLIIYVEAPERNDETDIEDLAALVEYRLGSGWSSVVVWDEDNFDADVRDLESVREAIDANLGIAPRGAKTSRKPTLPLFASGDSSLADDVSAEFGSE